MDVSRRRVLAMGVTSCTSALLGGCAGSKTNDGSSSSSLVPHGTTTEKQNNKIIFKASKAPPKELSRKTIGFTPQFIQAQGTGQKTFYEIGFSLHCGSSREFFKKNGKKILKEINDGASSVMFSHIVRTKNEIELGVEIMAVGQERYPEALLSVLGLSLRLNRSVSAKEAKVFLRSAGFNTNSHKNKKQSKAALGALRQVYNIGLGVKNTPYVKQSRIT